MSRLPCGTIKAMSHVSRSGAARSSLLFHGLAHSNCKRLITSMCAMIFVSGGGESIFPPASLVLKLSCQPAIQPPQLLAVGPPLYQECRQAALNGVAPVHCRTSPQCLSPLLLSSLRGRSSPV